MSQQTQDRMGTDRQDQTGQGGKRPRRHSGRRSGPQGRGRQQDGRQQDGRQHHDGTGRQGFGISPHLGIGTTGVSSAGIWWSVSPFDRPQLDDFLEANLSEVFDALPGLFATAPYSAIGVTRFFSEHTPSPDTLRFWSRAGDALADYMAQYRPTRHTLAIAEARLIEVEALAAEMGSSVDIRDVLGPRCTYAGQLYGMLVQGTIRDKQVIEQVANMFLAAANGFKRTGNARRQAECRLPAADALLQLGKTDRGRTEMVQGIVLLGTAEKNDALVQGGMAVDPAVADAIIRETAAHGRSHHASSSSLQGQPA